MQSNILKNACDASMFLIDIQSSMTDDGIL